MLLMDPKTGEPRGSATRRHLRPPDSGPASPALRPARQLHPHAGAVHAPGPVPGLMAVGVRVAKYQAAAKK
ncbi:MAG: hypothetical protein WKG07_20250 [Hymenobacter sp.]